MPGFYKIGMTERAPQQRVDELSKSTSVPFSFSIVCYGEVEEALHVEQELHEEFAHRRANIAREFFIFSTEELEECVDSLEGRSINFCHGDFVSHLERRCFDEAHSTKINHPFGKFVETIASSNKSDFEDLDVI